MKKLFSTAFLCFSCCFLYAQKVRVVDIESDDLLEKYSKVYVSSEREETGSIVFFIKDSAGDTVLFSSKSVSLEKGENKLPLRSFVDSVSFANPELHSFYKTRKKLMPGVYEVCFQVNGIQTIRHIEVEPEMLFLGFERVTNSDESILKFRINSEDSLYRPHELVLKWIVIGSPMDTFKVVSEEMVFNLGPDNFRVDKPYRFWIEENYQGIRVGQTKSQVQIPNPKGLNLLDPKDQLSMSAGIKLPVIDSIKLIPSVMSVFKKHTKLYGNLGAEYFKTTNSYSNNFFGNSSLISSGSIGVDISGIPIKSNLLFTWYERTGVQVCDFSFELDFQRLKQNLESKAKEKADAQFRERINYPDLTPDFDTLQGPILKKELKKLESEYSPEELNAVKSEMDELKLKEGRVNQRTDLHGPRGFVDSLRKDPISGIKKQTNDSINNFYRASVDSVNGFRAANEKRLADLREREQLLDSLKDAYQETQKKYRRFKELQDQYRTLLDKGIDIYDTEPKDLTSAENLVEFLPENLQKHGKTLLNIKSFELGWSHADFSYFTLNQKAISGLYLDYKGKHSGFKALKGTTNNGFDISGPSGLRNSHGITGFNTGVYREGVSEVGINYVRFESRNEPFQTHRSNSVLGIEVNQALFKNLWFTSEIARSHAVSANNASFHSSGSGVVSALLDFENSTSQAHSVGLELKANKSTTSYGVKVFRVGSGFQSLGNPFVISDRKGVLVDLRQSVADNRLIIIGKYARETNNLSQQYADTGLFHRYQIGVVARLFNKLNVNSFYVPVSSDFDGIKQHIHTLNSSVDISQKLGAVQIAGQIGHTLQINKLQLTELDLRTTELVSLNLVMSFRKGGRLGLMGNKSTSRSFFQQERVNGTFSYLIKKKLRHSFFTDLQRTNLYGARYLSGTGIEFDIAKHINVTAKCGYSMVQRSEGSMRTGGLDMNFGVLVLF